MLSIVVSSSSDVVGEVHREEEGVVGVERLSSELECPPFDDEEEAESKENSPREEEADERDEVVVVIEVFRWCEGVKVCLREREDIVSYHAHSLIQGLF